MSDAEIRSAGSDASNTETQVIVRQGFAAVAKATSVSLEQAGAGAVVAGGDVSFENAGAQAVLARGNVSITNGGSQSILAGGAVDIRQGGAAVVMAGGPVDVRNAVVGFVLSPRADVADSRVLFGPRSAFLFGAGLAIGIGLVAGRRRRD